jgi:hypothetical protein
MPAAIRRAGRDRQQRFHQRPQLVRHEVLDESCHGVRSCQTSPIGAKRRLNGPQGRLLVEHDPDLGRPIAAPLERCASCLASTWPPSARQVEIGRRAEQPRGMATTSARQPLHQPDQPQQPKCRPDGHHQPHPPAQLGPPRRRTPNAQHPPDLHRGHQHLGDAHRHQQPTHRGGIMPPPPTCSRGMRSRRGRPSTVPSQEARVRSTA